MQLECPINFRGCCKSQEPLERKNNPPNGSLEMIQDQPMQQSRGKDLNPANGSLWIYSSPTFCGAVWALGQRSPLVCLP